MNLVQAYHYRRSEISRATEQKIARIDVLRRQQRELKSRIECLKKNNFRLRKTIKSRDHQRHRASLLVRLSGNEYICRTSFSQNRPSESSIPSRYSPSSPSPKQELRGFAKRLKELEESVDYGEMKKLLDLAAPGVGGGGKARYHKENNVCVCISVPAERKRRRREKETKIYYASSFIVEAD
eukprot:jgi/Bigna1/145843/aug1.104_g20551